MFAILIIRQIFFILRVAEHFLIDQVGIVHRNK
jgi:hypothetical protein